MQTNCKDHKQSETQAKRPRLCRRPVETRIHWIGRHGKDAGRQKKENIIRTRVDAVFGNSDASITKYAPS